MISAKLDLKSFVVACLVVSIWVNASEIFRYFVIVMPTIRGALPTLPGVAPMDLAIFSIWGVWDTLLVVLTVFAYWLCVGRFGETLLSTVIAATFSWLLLFVLLWIAMVNMALAKPGLLLWTLPLSWLELVVACLIARTVFQRLGASPPRATPAG
jgi:hypothetical protein